MKALVIGSGIAGMASAVRLASSGYDVEVFESNEYPGGKLTEIRLGEYRFDAGPSLFTMPHLVDELFNLAGKEPSVYFSYHRKSISCHYFWEDGTFFKAPASTTEFSKAAAEVFDVSSDRIQAYLDETARLYNLTKDTFLAQSLHRVDSYLKKETLKTMLNAASMPLLSTLHGQNKKRLRHPKLVQLFDRFATYNGSNPYQTPGIMMLIPFLEYGIGTFFPKGGMHSITESIYKLASDIGVDFHFSTPVNEIVIDNNKVKGIKTNDGFREGDIVISNMDIHPTYKKLLPDILPPEKILAQERSSSALIFYWGISSEFEELDLH
ncbi:MAG: NAD(P)/FAD-dependent oxidoreductase, partial [Cyclobacteriaceae bacterium]